MYTHHGSSPSGSLRLKRGGAWLQDSRGALGTGLSTTITPEQCARFATTQQRNLRHTGSVSGGCDRTSSRLRLSRTQFSRGLGSGYREAASAVAPISTRGWPVCDQSTLGGLPLVNGKASRLASVRPLATLPHVLSAALSDVNGPLPESRTDC